MAESGPTVHDANSGGSAAHAAINLMLQIVNAENRHQEQKDRKYWLTLCRQCYKATSGNLLKRILEEE